MGCLLGKESNDFVDKNGIIDQMIQEDFRKTDNEYKLLLLGPGESGKSTFLKQVKIIHKQAYETEEERIKFKDVIYGNILNSIQSLIEASQQLGVEVDEENKEVMDYVTNLNPTTSKFSTQDVEKIKNTWEDQGIQETFKRRSEFQLIDCAKTFLDDIERVTDPEYIPTVEDIIHSRSRTTGIFDVDFNYGNLKFRLSDVGGQRNERRKWIHCFQDVTAVLFVTSLSEYDQKLFEDNNVSRIQESLLLFEDICSSRWFTETDIILFLNKDDLFREKIKTIDPKVCFEEYKGGCDYDNALEYITNQYKIRFEDESKQLYTYTTCATDTDSVRKVFVAVKDIILNSQAKDMGYV
ncbi:guanine nucleotide-binding protein g(o) subunit alpha [Anaeramoeba flamelloides]|uniref:Guanine nucleotide-binding protein g(O) subunit alpha n=1 Tax=Anaeramoeba flamelloides TaxID=1746091 RepID=A0AAV7Z6L6_9EUKA|nr:guanine nucleotide-binding protein g(o) subunit alpha [Anaeramoeba flamelloides]